MAVPGNETRPTSDKVKEALFSMIGPYFAGGEALDLFAGTGALGIEAISRGIERVVFVDVNKRSVETIRHNLQMCGIEDVAEIYRCDASQGLRALAKRGRKFDLIFLDPPYRMKEMSDILEFMELKAIVKHLATVVIEHEATYHYPETIGKFSLRRRSNYGLTALSVYKYNDEREE
jgi:16S rRNA (guanine966-N2)-methyltransferase